MALLRNIRLGWKGLARINALAHFFSSSGIMFLNMSISMEVVGIEEEGMKQVKKSVNAC
jgi:hypothetical protein